MCPSDHPFMSMQALEGEGVKLLEGVMTTLYGSKYVLSLAGCVCSISITYLYFSNPDMLSAILNSWANLVKRRPALVEFVVSSLSQWTPVKFEGQPASVVRSMEKSVRILLTHISR